MDTLQRSHCGSHHISSEAVRRLTGCWMRDLQRLQQYQVDDRLSSLPRRSGEMLSFLSSVLTLTGPPLPTQCGHVSLSKVSGQDFPRACLHINSYSHQKTGPLALPTLLNGDGENTDALAHSQRMVSANASREEYIDIGQRRFQQDAKVPKQQMNRRSRETFCGASMGKPQRNDEVPKVSCSRSTEVLGMLAAQNSVPRCLSDLFQIPDWEVHKHGFAAELLICLRDLSLLSSRRHVRRGGVHAEQILRECDRSIGM